MQNLTSGGQEGKAPLSRPRLACFVRGKVVPGNAPMQAEFFADVGTSLDGMLSFEDYHVGLDHHVESSSKKQRRKFVSVRLGIRIHRLQAYY